jgi:hypothetical protein
VQSEKFELMSAQQENERLREQIVQSPEKFQRSLAEMQARCTPRGGKAHPCACGRAAPQAWVPCAVRAVRSGRHRRHPHSSPWPPQSAVDEERNHVDGADRRCRSLQVRARLWPPFTSDLPLRMNLPAGC